MADVLAVRDEYRAQNWAMVIRECSPIGSFADSGGISEKAYYYWLRKLRSQMAEAVALQLVQLETAVTYARNQKHALYAFVEHGGVPISNNLAENAIHPFAVGRKNWLFCDTVKGLESSAIVYSLVETVKANGQDPYDHLFYILTMLPYLGTSPTHEELAKLMPWHPQVQAECDPPEANANGITPITNGRVHNGPGRKCLSRCVVIVRLRNVYMCSYLDWHY